MTIQKKYWLDENADPITGLYRIVALKDFGSVKKGDVGGYVESGSNLSQKGDCWIYDEAKVYDKAQVLGNAFVYGEAQVSDKAKVYGHAKVYGNAHVCGDAMISGCAWIFGYSQVYDHARVRDNANVHGHAKVLGDARVHGEAEVLGDAEISRDDDYIVFKNFWSSGRYFTWTRSNDMWTAGCFHGTGKELVEKAFKDSEVSGREYKRIVDYVESIKKDGIFLSGIGEFEVITELVRSGKFK